MHLQQQMSTWIKRIKTTKLLWVRVSWSIVLKARLCPILRDPAFFSLQTAPGLLMMSQRVPVTKLGAAVT